MCLCNFDLMVEVSNIYAYMCNLTFEATPCPKVLNSSPTDGRMSDAQSDALSSELEVGWVHSVYSTFLHHFGLIHSC